MDDLLLVFLILAWEYIIKCFCLFLRFFKQVLSFFFEDLHHHHKVGFKVIFLCVSCVKIFRVLLLHSGGAILAWLMLIVFFTLVFRHLDLGWLVLFQDFCVCLCWMCSWFLGFCCLFGFLVFGPWNFGDWNDLWPSSELSFPTSELAFSRFAWSLLNQGVSVHLTGGLPLFCLVVFFSIKEEHLVLRSGPSSRASDDLDRMGYRKGPWEYNPNEGSVPLTDRSLTAWFWLVQFVPEWQEASHLVWKSFRPRSLHK